MGEDRKSVEGKPGSVNESTEAAWSRLLGDTLSGTSGHEALSPVARHAVEVCGAAHAVALSGNADRTTTLGSWGLDRAVERSALLRYARQLAAWVTKSRVPLAVVRPESDERFPGPPDGILAATAVPWPDEDLPGALVVFFDHDAEVAEPAERHLQALVCLGALVLRGGMLRTRVAELETRLASMERQLSAAERLAAVGEMASEMSREIKAPLAGMGTLAAQAAEGLEPEDPRVRLLDVVVQEAARLERILAGHLEMAAKAEPVLQPDDLNRVAGECLMLVSEELRGRRIRLTRRLGPGIPALLLDADLLRRLLLNMLRGGMETCPRGGRVKVETKRAGNRVELTVAADGGHEPGQALEHLWRPFEMGGRAGAGGNVSAMGIQRILREHRGTLRARASAEWPFHLTLTLPITGNRDRRRAARERRMGRERRSA